MDKEAKGRLKTLIAQRRLNKYKRVLLATAKPAVRLSTTRVDEASIPVGATKFGGLPDLPDSFRWPTYNGRTIRFLAQISLGEMPAEQIDSWPLPAAGLLSFWYDTYGGAWGFDPKDAGSFQVHFFPHAPAELTRRPYPEFVPGEPPDLDPDTDWQPFKACAVSAKPMLTVKSDYLGSGDSDHIHNGLEALEAELEGDEPWHRLLGNPRLVQNEMEEECQLVANGIFCGRSIPKSDQKRAKALKRGAADWRLLLQIDTDEEGPDWMWGDAGSLYYWIRRQELERRVFSAAWGILQCC